MMMPCPILELSSWMTKPTRQSCTKDVPSSFLHALFGHTTGPSSILCNEENGREMLEKRNLTVNRVNCLCTHVRTLLHFKHRSTTQSIGLGGRTFMTRALTRKVESFTCLLFKSAIVATAKSLPGRVERKAGRRPPAVAEVRAEAFVDVAFNKFGLRSCDSPLSASSTPANCDSACGEV
ncbi:hypothetical protein K437DRAFT_6629 [Tilletiaria anomala UBC 951]|uniref:Uncharacterized protein n=1 Tax=Tilletiaria anomala (strain ATCC 24038 / CBS 436.72 / UBC 951) TaxID=1037660 RepID=A0A066WN97_TILAU|nr:uncharacterized protein K437DRAFT_6629 [Tilletiaria anomala UBC 951]KDN52459.1 hypothetical protein K437DRAFT_6629 [Tilletiaria anomala UBC 951]